MKQIRTNFVCRVKGSSSCLKKTEGAYSCIYCSKYNDCKYCIVKGMKNTCENCSIGILRRINSNKGEQL